MDGRRGEEKTIEAVQVLLHEGELLGVRKRHNAEPRLEGDFVMAAQPECFRIGLLLSSTRAVSLVVS